MSRHKHMTVLAQQIILNLTENMSVLCRTSREEVTQVSCGPSGELIPPRKGKGVTHREWKEKIEKGQKGQEGEKSWYLQFLYESYVL